MWIRSQDLFTLIKCERLSVRKCYGENYCVIGDECVVLGEYSTEEKALLVLDMIEKVSMYSGNTLFQMPDDDEVEV